MSSYTSAQKQEYIMEGRVCAGCKNRIKDALHCGIEGAKCDLINNCIKLPPGQEGKAQQIIAAIDPGAVLVPLNKQTNKTKGTFPGGFRAVRHQLLLFALAFGLFAGGFASPYFLSEAVYPRVEIALFFSAYILMGFTVVRDAFRSLISGKVFDENFLMSIASFGAVAVGHLPEAAGVMLFYQVGEFLQDLAVNRSRNMIKSLMEIRPETANLKTGTTTVVVPAGEVKVGESIIVKPGEKIPLDGTVTKGNSFVDTSALTGEHVPKRAAAGDQVLAGSLNTAGALEIRVTKSFEDSSVSKLLQLVEEAGERKAATEQFITRFARYYTPAVVIAAAAVALFPPLFIEGAGFSDWFYRALIFLVVSCPCALVISIPLTYFGGIGGTSRQGILVKGANFLDALAQLDTLAFDKTGTLTKGEFRVNRVTAFGDFSEDEVICLATQAELFSNHPVASSILDHFRSKSGTCGEIDRSASITAFEEIPGQGVKAIVDGKEVLAGNTRLMDAAGISYPEPDMFGTHVYVAVNSKLAGLILISDTIRPEAHGTLARLKQKGVRKTVLLTGDQEKSAVHVAKTLGISEYRYGLLPKDKVLELEKFLEERNTQGKGRVAFVGDGINDAPVIRAADIGIAMGGLGSDAAIESADVVIMDDDLEKIPLAVEMARFTKKIVIQNIILALGIKLLFMGMGTAGIASLWEAVFADVGVALLAVLNATRVLGFKPETSSVTK